MRELLLLGCIFVCLHGLWGIYIFDSILSPGHLSIQCDYIQQYARNHARLNYIYMEVDAFDVRNMWTFEVIPMTLGMQLGAVPRVCIQFHLDVYAPENCSVVVVGFN